MDRGLYAYTYASAMHTQQELVEGGLRPHPLPRKIIMKNKCKYTEKTHIYRYMKKNTYTENRRVVLPAPEDPMRAVTVQYYIIYYIIYYILYILLYTIHTTIYYTYYYILYTVTCARGAHESRHRARLEEATHTPVCVCVSDSVCVCVSVCVCTYVCMRVY
jgi:hypothetical protein